MSNSVTRKPIQGSSNNQRPQLKPPYPSSPKLEHQSVPTSAKSAESAEPESLDLNSDRRSRASSVSSHDTWNSGSDDDDDGEDDDENAADDEASPVKMHKADSDLQRDSLSSSSLPPSLRPGHGRRLGQNSTTEPISAQGPSKTILDSQSEWEKQSHLQPPTNNPFLNATGISTLPTQEGQPHWEDLSDLGGPPKQQTTFAGPSNQPPIAELDSLLLHEKQSPYESPITSDLSNLEPPIPISSPAAIQSQATDTPSNNPWQQDLDRQKQSDHARQAPLIDLGLDTSTNEWESQSGHPPSPKLASIASPGAQAKLEVQRNVVYQIKQINWLSGSGSSGSSALRRVPILTQNANGPCPLLALVNALVLSTPFDGSTAIHEALQSREQITLGLLLDVVFEELVRRSEQFGRDLPDIDELYTFLIGLHTGMNVNPRFVASDQSTDTVGGWRTSPGAFEQTHDMKLYGTFGVPLVHGWMLPFDSDNHKAFERTAQTYDDAQNVRFREEELEEKASAQGLDAREEQIAQDILAIKQFMSTYPSQLTEHGLSIISNWIQPGQVAILFRNDHFSTLYKEPRKGMLMTLVTDAGYAGHDEIVWESLADISGAQAEFFSGDFRSVGMSSARPPSTSVDPVMDADNRPAHVNTEQEDHDLALALQLQEEENQRNDTEAAERRRREEELSLQFIEQERSNPQVTTQNTAAAPQVPPRGVSTTNPPVVTHVSAPRHNADEVAPPPSYEQAASDRIYRDGDERHALPPAQGDALGALHALTAQEQQQRLRPGMSPSRVGYSSPTAAAGFRRPSGTNPAFGPTSSATQSGPPPAGQSPGVYTGSYPGNNPAAYVGPGGRRYDDEKCVVM